MNGVNIVVFPSGLAVSITYFVPPMFPEDCQTYEAGKRILQIKKNTVLFPQLNELLFQMCPLVVTIALSLCKQTVNNGVEKVLPSAANPKPRCLSAYPIMC